MYVLGAGWGLHTTALCEGLGRWGSRVAKGNSLRHPLTVPVPLEGWIAHTQKGWCSTPARTPTIFTIQQVKHLMSWGKIHSKHTFREAPALAPPL